MVWVFRISLNYRTNDSHRSGFNVFVILKQKHMGVNAWGQKHRFRIHLQLRSHIHIDNQRDLIKEVVFLQ